MTIELDVKSIRALYTDPLYGKIAVCVFDGLAGSAGSPGHITFSHVVEQFTRRYGNSPIRGELVQFFRKLEFYGAGTLVGGGGKTQTEFKFSVNEVALSRFVTGEHESRS